MTTERPQSFTEELANSISHGFGLLVAIVALPLLIDVAAERGRTVDMVGAAVFGGTMVLVYFASAAYHALPAGPAKRVFNKLDHASIFLFIAGSYTPFALAVVDDGWGWTALALVWALAAAGVTLKVLDRLRHPWLSVGAYLALGWIVVAALLPLAERISGWAFGLIVGGGGAYTAGIVFFVLDSRLRYAHFVWHLFVLVGSACHLLAALSPLPWR